MGVYKVYGTRADGAQWLIECVGTKREAVEILSEYAEFAPLSFVYTAYPTDA